MTMITAAFNSETEKDLVDEHAYVAERIAAMNLSVAKIAGSNEAEELPEDDDDDEKKKLAKEKAMAVTTGVPHKENPYQIQIEDKQAFRLREKLVRKKHRNLYKSMKAGQETGRRKYGSLGKRGVFMTKELKKTKKAEKRKQKTQALEALALA